MAAVLSSTLSSCGFINGISRNYTQEQGPRFAVLNHPAPKTLNNGTIKIVSYNIKFSKKVNEAIETLSRYPELADADIICLQEMSLEAVHNIAQTLSYNYVYYPAVAHPITNDVFGNAVLSKWPVLDDRKVILPSQRKKQLQRIAVGANIKIGNREIMVYSVHFDIFITPFGRRTNVNRLILSMPPMIRHTIVAGDFNSFTSISKNAIVNQMTSSGFNYITHGVGWTHKQWYTLNKKSSVDHIFAKGFEKIQAGKIEDRAGSDHLPIWAVLKIE